MACEAYHPGVTRIEVLRPFVEQTVAKYLHLDHLQVADDGTIPIRAGSTIVNVRLMDGPGDKPLLQVYSPILLDVDRSPELLEKLNEINTQLTFTRTFWADRQVILAMDLLAETLDEEQIAHACSFVSLAADSWDETLRQTFGGRLFFNEEPPATGEKPEAGDAGEPATTTAEAGPKGEDPPPTGYI
jgi:T3SS (YopN, CesT) and YbjN peptide-binding chaperone 1